MSLQKSSRQTLSAIEMRLRETVQSARRLIEMGWRDFRAADHPETVDVVIMACEAFLYLSLNDEGNWNQTTNVLAAIKAYLDGETGREADAFDLTRLAKILMTKPVRRSEVEDWFEAVYRL